MLLAGKMSWAGEKEYLTEKDRKTKHVVFIQEREYENKSTFLFMGIDFVSGRASSAAGSTLHTAAESAAGAGATAAVAARFKTPAVAAGLATASVDDQ